ncbi:MAG: sulfotransferase domain-containing protein [Chitinophagales bacterium]|nr:sulfotransferase domain-containing protein [Chitinophagales bacterium]
MKYRFPNLFIPGAGKSGTSSLHLYLNQHPLVQMASVKEPHFFSIDKYFEKGFDQYLNLFSTSAVNIKYYGESSTTYMASLNAIRRIQQYIADPKFIFILRNPIQRIVSHYNWLLSQGRPLNSFREELEADIKKPFNPNFSFYNGFYKSYLELSHYGKWISEYIRVFGRSNIHIIITEELNSQPMETINSCYRFLEISELKTAVKIQANGTQKSYKTNRARLNLPAIKKLVPNRVKNYLIQNEFTKQLLLQEEKHNIQTYSPDESVSIWLTNLLKDDVMFLKQITAINFSSWKEFQ